MKHWTSSKWRIEIPDKLRAGFSQLLSLAMAWSLLASPLFGAGANAPWGVDNGGGNNQVAVAVAIQSGQGTDTAVWDSAARADQTQGLAWMKPVGDGTYQYGIPLLPFAQYNFLFFASATVNSVSYGRQGEPVPNNGADAGTFLSLSSSSIQPPATGSLQYGNINGGALSQGGARRLLTMPGDTDLPPGSTLYVFNNFASTPNGVANYNTQLLSTSSVKLTWQGGLGYWGAGAPALDVLAGSYFLYRSFSYSTGPYTLIASLPGSATTYTDTSLQTGVTAYYVFVSSDGYTGPTNSTGTARWPNLARLNPSQAGFVYDTNQYTYNDKSVKPAQAVWVIFKVENMDEDYVLKHNSVVYLTPWDQDGRTYVGKTPGTFIRVVIPKT